MTAKNYRAVAAILSERRKQASSKDAITELEAVTLELASLFRADNARFNAGRFFRAAGFEELTGTRLGLN